MPNYQIRYLVNNHWQDVSFSTYRDLTRIEITEHLRSILGWDIQRFEIIPKPSTRTIVEDWEPPLNDPRDW